jgi:hypothetical protein
LLATGLETGVEVADGGVANGLLLELYAPDTDDLVEEVSCGK